MNEEEAIKYLKKKIEDCNHIIEASSYIGNKKAYAKERTKYKEILNLIENQQTESEKKDKIIDLMTKEISKSIVNTCPLEDYNVDLDCACMVLDETINKLENIGDYVRTIKGLITKIIGLDEFIEDDGTTFYETEENPGYNDLCSKEIVKHSKNIIDLIEVGDYVNGKLIHKIEKRPNYCYLYYGNCKTFVDYEIKTIVTKEQFASIEYKVEEEVVC